MLGGATQPTTTKHIPRQVIKRKIAGAPEEIMKIRLAVAFHAHDGVQGRKK
jgi:hypothetical protein